MSQTNDMGSGSIPVEITEDEAAVYDRQIRLWGLEAQQRMRNATILVANLRGVATETIKNIVLAGIGKLIVVDARNVMPEDLGAGFFYRDEDVGTKRVDAAKARIGSLNPLVNVEVVSATDALHEAHLDTLLNGVDMVCVTDLPKVDMIRINAAARRLGKPFYAGGSYGLLGYIFCDLLQHHYLAPDRANPKESSRDTRMTATYCSLDVALKHSWSAQRKKPTKEINPAVVFTVLSLWEYQSQHQGQLPDGPSAASELQTLADGLLRTAKVNEQAITTVPSDLIRTMSTTAAHEFSPVCAVVGGVMAQDILKALAAREAPIANLFVFEGSSGGGTVARLGMQ